MGEYNKAIQAQSPVLHLTMRDQGQMFAGVATIRAAVFDIIDSGWQCASACDIKHPFHFDPYDEGAEEDAVRHSFIDLVIKRIAELQAHPHDGIKLENLCPRHRREALPAPTVQACGMCQVERGSR